MTVDPYVVRRNVVTWLAAGYSLPSRCMVSEARGGEGISYTAGQYTLRGPDGTVVHTEVLAAAFRDAVVRPPLAATQVVGIYREEWEFTVNGETVHHVGLVGVASIPITMSITEADVTKGHPLLECAGPDDGSWMQTVADAFDVISEWLLNHECGAELWTASQVKRSHKHMSRAMAYERLFGPSDERAVAERTMATTAWDEMRPQRDDDGDGVRDGDHYSPLPSFGPPVWGRRG